MKVIKNDGINAITITDGLYSLCFVANVVGNPKLLKAFGDRLREIRTKKDISQRQLANLCQIEHSQINRIENGKQNCTIATMFLIADALGVKPEELVKLK